MKLQDLFESLNEESEPTNKSLWKKAIAKAKETYDVYPSAYANGFAVRWYNKQGGKWRTVKEAKSLNESTSIIKAYHGSNTKINQFSLNYVDQGIDQFGSGIYFTNDLELASRYGPHIHEVELDTSSCFPNNFNLDKNLVTQLIKQSPELDEALEGYGDVSFEGYQKVLNRAIETYLSFGNDYIKGLMTINNDFYQGKENTQKFLKTLSKLTGHTCIVTKFENSETTIIVVIDPSIVKIVNVKELSEGLDDWFEKEHWVDISRPKKGGGFHKCGASADSGSRGKDGKRAYPKCVTANKAKNMTDKEIESAVRRKRNKVKKDKTPNDPVWVKTDK